MAGDAQELRGRDWLSTRAIGQQPEEPSNVPAVSVVIPTFNRPGLLSRAIQSVLGQTETRWELIISDDEPRAGAGRVVAESFARRDGRIRVVANPGPRGQAANLNHAMSGARAGWIKPLYDDDVLRAGCLAEMLGAVRGRPQVVLARCLADHYEDGMIRRRERIGRRGPIEFLDGPGALLAMLIQDLEIGMPTQVLVRADAVRAGGWMDAPAGVHVGVDWWWYATLLRVGGLLLINHPLVEDHQGGHSTVTSRATRADLYEEMRGLRRALFPLVPEPLRPARVNGAVGLVSLVEAMVEAKSGRMHRTLRRAAGVHDAEAWRMTARWALRRAFPGRFERVPRRAVEAVATVEAGAAVERPADMLNASWPMPAPELVLSESRS